MDFIIFLILQFLVFSKVHGQDCQQFTPQCQRKIRSASKEISIIQCWGKPLYAYCKATDGTVFPIPGFTCEHSTCPDDSKGGNSKGGKRTCFANDNDPLDIAYTSKYGSNWPYRIDGSKALLNGRWSDTVNRQDNGKEHDEQSFFPKITNQNECKALECELIMKCSDCCWNWEHSWEKMDVLCFLLHNPGTRDQNLWNPGVIDSLLDDFGPGCYCKSEGTMDSHECCLRDGGCKAESRLSLQSRRHPCNNIGGIDYGSGSTLPQKEWTNTGCSYGSYSGTCCSKDSGNCVVTCNPTNYISTLANMMKISGGRPKRFRGKK